MSRRRGQEDPEFGSDSFLDIIANIVGILIILIVIAGVKVARQPAVAAQPEPNVEVVSSSASVEVTEPAEVEPRHQEQLFSRSQLDLLQEEYERELSSAEELQGQLREVEQQAAGVAAQSDQIQDQVRGATAAIDTVRRDVSGTVSTQDSVAEDTAEVRALVRSLKQQAAVEEDRQRLIEETTDRVYERQRAANKDLQEISRATQELQELLEERREQQVADADRLEHRLSPVARTESDQEIHFRLSSGHISWVPLEALLERLKSQVTNRGGLIRRFGRYDGVCGPVNGYSMKYTVERHTPSPLDNLNGVAMGYRISVSRWTISPTDRLRAETVDDALKFGSRFRQIAEAADPDATMTIWLYSDDFDEFRRLREFGHGLGLRVAARPLPAGSEITGSPSGSRSSAQ